jgi:hypothetical protein
MCSKLTVKSLLELHKKVGPDVMKIILKFYDDLFYLNIFNEQCKKIHNFINEEILKSSNDDYIITILDTYYVIKKELQRIILDKKIICKIKFIHISLSKINFILMSDKDLTLKDNNIKVLSTNFKISSTNKNLNNEYHCYIYLN